ncbi:MAG: hypothetical protein MZU84_01545 [Sphingobacterium sp.]|nr:hypothetical protein [Sphingobacterium sp.]
MQFGWNRKDAEDHDVFRKVAVQAVKPGHSILPCFYLLPDQNGRKTQLACTPVSVLPQPIILKFFHPHQPDRISNYLLDRQGIVLYLPAMVAWMPL